MRILRIVFLVAIICFYCNQLFSQTESSSIIKPFGIGLHIEQFKLYDIEDLDNAPANKIILVISPNNSFRLEPEFGLKTGDDITSDLKNSSIYWGLGALGMIQHNGINIYGGLRFEYAIIKWEESGSAFDYKKITNKSNRIIIGPAIGCEYYLGDNFALGGEVALKYAILKTTKDPMPSYYKDQESNYFVTDTGLFIRFYF